MTLSLATMLSTAAQSDGWVDDGGPVYAFAVDGIAARKRTTVASVGIPKRPGQWQVSFIVRLPLTDNLVPYLRRPTIRPNFEARVGQDERRPMAPAWGKLSGRQRSHLLDTFSGARPTARKTSKTPAGAPREPNGF